MQILSRYKCHLLFLLFLFALRVSEELVFNLEATVPALLQVYVLDLARILESN